MKKKVSKMDLVHYKIIRKNIEEFLQQSAKKYDQVGLSLLEIAPQVHSGAKTYFTKSILKTLDLDPEAKSDYCLDICKNNKTVISDNTYDIINCNEVLEHTLQPFLAIAEMYRMLKPGGILLITTPPFNFRIHGPLPDCWRFTEHGLRALLSNLFEIIELKALEKNNRFLMPIHYTVIARKN